MCSQTEIIGIIGFVVLSYTPFHFLSCNLFVIVIYGISVFFFPLDFPSFVTDIQHNMNFTAKYDHQHDYIVAVEYAQLKLKLNISIDHKPIVEYMGLQLIRLFGCQPHSLR